MTHRTIRRAPVRIGAAFFAVSLLAAACGGDDDEADGTDQTTTIAATDTTVAETTDTTDTDTTATTEDGGDTATTAAEEEDSTATTAAAPASDCDPGATLVWGYGDQIREWDPHDSPAGQDQWYLMTVYDRLFRQSPEGDTLPDLVEEWDFSDDGLTLTMSIRQGVKFHDGSDLTTDIVVQNIDRARGVMDAPDGEEGFSTSFAADLRSIELVTAVDDVTVEVVTSAPNVALPNILSDRPGMVLHPSTFDGSANLTPIGTGPFRLDSFTAGDGGEAVLSKFGEYWDADNINLASLVLKDIRDPSARINALQSGDIDGARIEPVDFEVASSNPDLTVTTGDTVEVLWFNMDVGTTPELSMPEVRDAMSLAIDRQALIDSLAFGQGTATETLMPPFYWASSPNVEPVYDVEAAKAALAAAGVSGFTIPVLAASTQGLGPSVAQAVGAMLAEVGITVAFEVAGDNLASRLYVDRDGGGVVGPWSGRPDPAQTFANVDGPGFVNIAKTVVPEIDALLIEANAETDTDARQKLFWQLDELSAVNHTSGIALLSPKTIFAHANNVSGLPVYVQGKHEFRDVCVAPS